MTVVLADDGPDAGLAWHFGDPMREQRSLGESVIDLGNRTILRISGPDRISWLHSITTGPFEGAAPGQTVPALVLDAQGHIKFGFRGADDGECFTLITEQSELADWLDSMRFMLRVEVERIDGSVWWFGDDAASAVASGAAGGMAEAIMLEGDFGGAEVVATEGWQPDASLTRAGTWAWEAARVAAGVPRIGVDTDERTIPNEIGLYATELDKGCYPGQETVARIHNLGRPPRRMILAHLDGSVEELPALGASITNERGREVGRIGASVRHFELGPIALGLVKRAVPTAETLFCGDVSLAQQALVDPDVGLHFRPGRSL